MPTPRFFVYGYVMKKLIIALTLMIGFNAQAKGFTGADFRAMPLYKKEFFLAAVNSTLSHDASNLLCPEGVSIDQGVAALNNHIELHPEEWNKPVVQLYIDVLTKTFKCEITRKAQ